MAAPSRSERDLLTADLADGRVLFAYSGLVSGDSGLTWDNDTQTLTVSNLSVSTVATLPSSVVTLTGTQTLTNKTLTGNPGVSRIARCTANLSKTNSTYEAITGLSAQLSASKRYEICVCVAVTTGAGGTKIRSALSSAGVSSGSRIFYQIVDSAASPSVFIVAGSLVGSTNIEIYNDIPIGTTSLTIWMAGIVATQAAATLSIQGAQNTTDADPTIFLENSFLKVTELE